MRYIYFCLFVIILLSSCVAPVANFRFSAQKFVAPVEVGFENLSENAEMYEWTFGDDSTSYEPSPSHRFTTSGNYLVTLKAKKGKKTKKIERRIFVEAPEVCLIELETNYGIMLLQLYDATPLHRDNFVKLVENGFYDGLLFHRVIDGFMIQGGDPDSRNATPDAALGGGGPGYQIPAEFVDSLIHVKGALAAARTPNPEKKSSGSQFYIVQGGPLIKENLQKSSISYTKEQIEAYSTLGGTPQLDQEYTVFGKVIQGLEIIDKIAKVKTNPANRPVEDVKIKMRFIN